MREDEIVCPVKVLKERLYLIVTPAEPFCLLIIYFYPHANHFKVRMPYVLLRSQLVEAEFLAVVGLEVHGN